MNSKSARSYCNSSSMSTALSLPSGFVAAWHSNHCSFNYEVSLRNISAQAPERLLRSCFVCQSESSSLTRNLRAATTSELTPTLL